ncbi:MAG TPA: hypothetical protein VMD59_14630, partial [Acidimicrobiales bacterium]|nr:hypothetical protein [Acidimicrobiales bacterium]
RGRGARESLMSTLSMSELRRLADEAESRDADRLRGDLIDLLGHHELLDVLTREYLREILEGNYRRLGSRETLDATG